MQNLFVHFKGTLLIFTSLRPQKQYLSSTYTLLRAKAMTSAAEVVFTGCPGRLQLGLRVAGALSPPLRRATGLRGEVLQPRARGESEPRRHRLYDLIFIGQ